MNLYVDTEFTGLRKDTDLISIGIITDHNDSFYAEFTDYDESKCDDWIKENVIAKLLIPQPTHFDKIDSMATQYEVKGTRNEVRTKLIEFLRTIQNKYNSAIQFVSDVAHYDFVLLLDLIADGGTVFDIPAELNISSVCHDINHDIATHYGTTDSEAFDYSREIIVSNIATDKPLFDSSSKHNALYDAYVISLIYNGIHK